MCNDGRIGFGDHDDLHRIVRRYPRSTRFRPAGAVGEAELDAVLICILNGMDESHCREIAVYALLDHVVADPVPPRRQSVALQVQGAQLNPHSTLRRSRIKSREGSGTTSTPASSMPPGNASGVEYSAQASAGRSK